MKQTNNNWKNMLVIGMLAGGSVMVGCKNNNNDYKTFDSDAPVQGDATTLDSTQGNTIDESMHSLDNTSNVPAGDSTMDRNSSMANGSNMATGSKMVEPDNKANTGNVSTRPVRKARYRYTYDWSSMKNSSAKAVRDADGIYSRTEVMPMYPGGEDALRKFVEQNIEYPETAVQDGEEGEVKVVFTVNEMGKVTNAVVVSDDDVDHQLEQEAKNVVSRMPAWTPGMVKGRPVKTRLTLPITYRIEQ